MNHHSQNLKDELNRLAQRAEPTASATMNGDAGGVKWKLQVRKLESLGCRIDSATFSVAESDTKASSKCGPVSQLGSNRVPQAEAVAQRICDKVTYLMEPLALLETDAEANHALARSTKVTPTERGNGYFEVQVTGESVQFRRYIAEQGKPRENADFCVTNETLDRLVEDVVDSIAPQKPTRRERYRSR